MIIMVQPGVNPGQADGWIQKSFARHPLPCFMYIFSVSCPTIYAHAIITTFSLEQIMLSCPSDWYVVTLDVFCILSESLDVKMEGKVEGK